MVQKSKDVLMVALTILVVSVMFSIRNSSILYKIRPQTFSEAILDDFDSTKLTSQRSVEAFSNSHRLHLEMTQNLKYYSKNDTIVSIFDTLGTRVGDTSSYSKLKKSEQKIIRDLLNRSNYGH